MSRTLLIVLFSKTDELREPFIAAKEAELDNWKANNVFQRVKDVGQPAISSRGLWQKREFLVPRILELKLGLFAEGMRKIPHASELIHRHVPKRV